MKALLPLLLPVLLSASLPSRQQRECIVKSVLEAVPVPVGSLAVQRIGDPVEITDVLVPAKLGAGNYEVMVSRKAQDLYSVDGTALYLRTQVCFEFVYMEKAILQLEAYQGFLMGTIYFQ